MRKLRWAQSTRTAAQTELCLFLLISTSITYILILELTSTSGRTHTNSPIILPPDTQATPTSLEIETGSEAHTDRALIQTQEPEWRSACLETWNLNHMCIVGGAYATDASCYTRCYLLQLCYVK